MFIDEVIIKVTAGTGGDGCTSFRHEKYVEKGGPDGGNGGRGGNIIFKADEGLHTLLDLRYLKNIKAKNGINGEGSNRTGASAEDTIIKVPVGTVLTDNETSLVLCDLTKHDEEFIVCTGGRGGKGNAAYKSNKNKAPLTSENGEPGEYREVKCELKLLADVGLIGFPSVGKSSLISVVSASKPKIADYPFTTLTPNLGVVRVGSDSFVIADLPGLIEGASTGVGLGDKFLRHAERTKLLIHILDMSSLSTRNVVEDYKIIREEVKNFSEKLYNKKEILVANKMDAEGAEENLKLFKKAYPKLEIFEISVIKKQGIEKLLYRVNEELKNIETTNLYEENELENYVLYKFKEEKPYTIRKEGNVWIIEGEELVKLFKMTKFNSLESETRFAKKLQNLKVEDELRSLGAEDGDTVRILNMEFTLEERLK